MRGSLRSIQGHGIVPSLADGREQRTNTTMDRKPGAAGVQDRRSERAAPAGTAARKPLPPEKTHAEEFYYQKQMTARTSVEVVMSDGERLRGVIEWYDKDCIKVHREDGPNLLIFKRYIKYITKDPSTP